ncbi:MAG: alpha/beta fold hydrolase [Sphingomicrobium sp.]
MARLQGVRLALALVASTTATLAAPPVHGAASVTVDPPRDARHPAANQQLLIRSNGSDMNALLLRAQGPGPKPTLILLHGLPGNERNLDLAQAIRRTGWNVLTFTYRGAWGSQGEFSLASAIDDGTAALAFARSAEAAKLGIDPRNIVIGGHSMGGGIAALVAAGHPDVAGVLLLDAWNIGATAHQLAAGGDKARRAFVAEASDFGHALSGATPQSIADELAAHDGSWNILSTAEYLRATPVLSIAALHGGYEENRATTAALKKHGNQRVTALEIDSDHAFADHRIAVAQAIASWLAGLARR